MNVCGSLGLSCARHARQGKTLYQDAEKGRQQKKTVIWFIWFVSFVWLNKTNQIDPTFCCTEMLSPQPARDRTMVHRQFTHSSFPC